MSSDASRLGKIQSCQPLIGGVLQFANAFYFTLITYPGLVLPPLLLISPLKYILTYSFGYIQANSELNDMIEHYEGLLLSREQDINAWKGKLSSLEAELRSSFDSRQKLEDRVDHLSSELLKSNNELQDHIKGTTSFKVSSRLLKAGSRNLNQPPMT